MKLPVPLLCIALFMVACEQPSPLVDPVPDTPIPTEDLKRACEQGEMQACYEYAYRITPSYEQRDHRPLLDLKAEGVATPERDKRVALFQKTCDAGYIGACLELAEEYQPYDAYLNSWDVSDGTAEKLCELGINRFCSGLAEQFTKEGERDRAARLYSRLKHYGWIGDVGELSRMRSVLREEVGPEVVEVPELYLKCVEPDAELESPWKEREQSCRTFKRSMCESFQDIPVLDLKASLPWSTRNAYFLCSRMQDEHQCERAAVMLYRQFLDEAREQGVDPLHVTTSEDLDLLEEACNLEHPQACHLLGNMAYFNEACSIAEYSFRLGKDPAQPPHKTWLRTFLSSRMFNLDVRRKLDEDPYGFADLSLDFPLYSKTHPGWRQKK